MKQLLMILVALLLMVNIDGQVIPDIPDMNDEQILDLYWKYRNTLRNNFLKIGADGGESIPASARRVGQGYSMDNGTVVPSEWNGGSPDLPSSMWWGDATITLSNYIMVLATEFKLLQNQGEDVNPTAVELYYALNALIRLDLVAEPYLSANDDNQLNIDLNGLLLRNDVDNDILDNFQNDYSVVFDRPADFQRVQAGKYFIDSGGEPQTFGKGNVQSLDQLTAITLACETVKMLVNWSTAYLPDGSSHNLGQMSIDIAQKIIDRLDEHEWVIYDHRGMVYDENSLVEDNLGHLVPRGFSIQGNQPGFEEAIKYMTYNYSGYE